MSGQRQKKKPEQMATEVCGKSEARNQREKLGKKQEPPPRLKLEELCLYGDPAPAGGGPKEVDLPALAQLRLHGSALGGLLRR